MTSAKTPSRPTAWSCGVGLIPVKRLQNAPNNRQQVSQATNQLTVLAVARRSPHSHTEVRNLVFSIYGFYSHTEIGNPYQLKLASPRPRAVTCSDTLVDMPIGLKRRSLQLGLAVAISAYTTLPRNAYLRTPGKD